jgi:hypothetical protein
MAGMAARSKNAMKSGATVGSAGHSVHHGDQDNLGKAATGTRPLVFQFS